MKIEASTVDEYMKAIPEDRQPAMQRLRAVIVEHLPDGFVETMSYGMPAYVVPHSLYPSGYHCNPEEPLPFMNIASQKNFVALYHMGIYSDRELLDWFTTEYPNHSKRKLDMGKSCIRFKHLDHIPYGLIAELAAKMSVADWIEIYERALKR